MSRKGVKNDGRKKHPLYRTWNSMHGRCSTPSSGSYYLYGQRGIAVAKEWRDFWAFVKDMGPRPSPSHSVDRIDGKRGYSPDNCRWATPREQILNSRCVRWIEHDGQRLTVTEWAQRFNITQSALSHRFRKHGEQRAIAMGARRKP